MADQGPAGANGQATDTEDEIIEEEEFENGHHEQADQEDRQELDGPAQGEEGILVSKPVASLPSTSAEQASAETAAPVPGSNGQQQQPQQSQQQAVPAVADETATTAQAAAEASASAAQAAEAAAQTAAAAASSSAPRGLPGLPPRGLGGLGALPPRGLPSLPARGAATSTSTGSNAPSGPATGAASESTSAPASTTAAGASGGLAPSSSSPAPPQAPTVAQPTSDGAAAAGAASATPAAGAGSAAAGPTSAALPATAPAAAPAAAPSGTSASKAMPSLPARPGGGPPGGGRAGLGLPARPGMGAPAGLGGAGLGLPARAAAGTAAGAAGSAASSTPPAAPTAASSSSSSSQPAAGAPSTAGSAKPSASAAAPAPTAATASSTTTASPSLPTRPSLPARPTPSGAASAATGGAGLGAGLGARPAGAGAGAGAPSGPTGAAAGLGPGAGAGLPMRPGFMRPAGAAAPAAPAAAPTTSSAVAAPAPPPPSGAVDSREDGKAQRLQRRTQDLRVKLIRAATRLGQRSDGEQVNAYLQAIERTERGLSAQLYKHVRTVNLQREAEKTARELDSSEPATATIDVGIKILLIGMTGTGKSELINSLLERPASRTNAYKESTKRIKVHRGSYRGVQLTLIDTPGLHAAAGCTAENRTILRGVKKAFLWHKPQFVFYVDRLDASRPGLGELALLGQISQVLGADMWQTTVPILTHAHAARQILGAQYEQYSRQRRSIVQQLIRQASGNMQTRNPNFLVDSHPDCPTNSFGQAVIQDGGQAVPWKQQVLMMLVGSSVLQAVQANFRAAMKAKPGAAGAKQDIFKQMMRSRLPPVHFFVEQMAEGVLKPDGWGTMPHPLMDETEDEEAEGFEHAYYTQMYDLAVGGDPWAAKEYATMVRKLNRLRSAYHQSYEDQELDDRAHNGPEGMVAEPINFDTTFDPDDAFSHRFTYVDAGTDIQVIPSMEYYGPEHDDPISGMVLQYEAQPFNRHGWGGFPFDLTVCVEKDKNNFCLQGESHVSIVHAVPPFGNRHITQVTGSWELLRPNIKDVMYQLEVDTFKDGLFARNDHAGCGLMACRLGEGGNPRKGPMGVGLRLQDSGRLGPFKIEAVASKVTCDAQGGGRDEGWGGRAFVHYDYLPGVGMTFDFYQQRTKDSDAFEMRGVAANFTYEFEAVGAACDLEVDFPGDNVVHVGMSVFSANDYRWAWLLLIPGWNFLKEKTLSIVNAIRQGGEEAMEEGVEGEEGAEEGMLGEEEQYEDDM